MKSGTETAAGSSAATTAKSPTEPLPTVRREVSQAARPIPKAAPSPARPQVAKVGITSSAKEESPPSSTLKCAATTSNLETKKKVFHLFVILMETVVALVTFLVSSVESSSLRYIEISFSSTGRFSKPTTRQS